MKTDFLARAKKTLNAGGHAASALAAVPLALVASTAGADPIQTSEMILDDMFVGYWNASGFFTEPGYRDDNSNFISLGQAPTGSTIGGTSLGEGFKLYGDATMSDGYLGQVGQDWYDNYGNEAYGVGFAWTGTFVNPVQEGDFVALDYDFTIEMTDNQQTSSSVYWELSAGVFEVCCGESYVPGTYVDTQRVWSLASDNAYAGSTQFTGSIQSDELYSVYEESNYQWAVVLTTYWNDDDAWGAAKSGDTLRITVPQNSIDVGLNQVPTASVPAPASAWLLLIGLAGLARRARRAPQLADDNG